MKHGWKRCFVLLSILFFCMLFLKPMSALAAPKLDLGKYIKGDNYLVLVCNYRKNTSIPIRSTPSSKASTLAKLKHSDAIVVDQSKLVAGTKTKWIPVIVANLNKTGYVSTSKVRFKVINMEKFKNGGTPYADTAIRYGLKYLGTPYQSGGNDINKGICCSALVTKCFRKAGREMPVTYVINQYNICKFISRKQLKPGDLIFYRANSRAPYGGLVHVAIYIGDGMILNATGHTGTTYPNGGICIKALSYGTHLASRAIYGRLP